MLRLVSSNFSIPLFFSYKMLLTFYLPLLPSCCPQPVGFPHFSSHLTHDAVLHVGFLVAALFAHQCDLQLTEGFGQDVALGEELPPLYDVGL